MTGHPPQSPQVSPLLPSQDPAYLSFAERRALFGQAAKEATLQKGVQARPVCYNNGSDAPGRPDGDLPKTAEVGVRLRSQTDTFLPSPPRRAAVRSQSLVGARRHSATPALGLEHQSYFPAAQRSRPDAAGSVAALVSPVLPMLESTFVAAKPQLQRPSQLQVQAPLQPRPQPQPHRQSQALSPQLQPQMQPHPGVATQRFVGSPVLRSVQGGICGSPLVKHIPSPVLVAHPSPSLACQPSPGTAASPHLQGRPSSVLVAHPSPSLACQPSPGTAGSPHLQGQVTVRKAVPGAAAAAALSFSQAALPGRPSSSQAGSPVIALLVQSPAMYSSSPALQKLTPPPRRASPLLQFAASAAASSPSTTTAAASTATGGLAGASAREAPDEDDLFELPPPVLDLDADTAGLATLSQDGAASSYARERWSSVRSEDGASEPGADDQDPQQDDDHMVRSPRGKEVLLDGSFNIWFQASLHAKKRPKSEQQYEEGLQCVGTFNSVQEFWRFWNAIDLQKVPNFCSLSVFKHPIKPMWEDAHNKDGGQWVIRCSDRAQTADFFTKLALSLIGGYFDCHDSLCGVVLSTKPKFNSLGLWNCQVDESLFVPVKHELQELLGLGLNDGVHVEYKEHFGALQNNSSKRREVTNGSMPTPIPAEPSSARASAAVVQGSASYGSYSGYSDYSGTYGGYAGTDGSGCGGYQYAMQETSGQYVQSYGNGYGYYNPSEQYTAASGYYTQQELWTS